MRAHALAGRPRRRAFRPRRVVPAVLVAAPLLGAALLVLVEVIAGLLHRPALVLPVTWLARLGRTSFWDDVPVLSGSATLAALGLFLLALALWPGRPRAVAMTSDDPDVIIGVTSSGLRRYVEDAAVRVPGITAARTVVGPRRVRVRATTPLRDVSGLTEEVRAAVERRFEELALARPPRLRVTVRTERA
jgi:hypothetical protein